MWHTHRGPRRSGETAGDCGRGKAGPQIVSDLVRGRDAPGNRHLVCGSRHGVVHVHDRRWIDCRGRRLRPGDEPLGLATHSDEERLPFRPVEICFRHILVARKMIGPQWLAYAVFFAEPFAEVDHLAAIGTERAHRLREEVVFLLANRATKACGFRHACDPQM